MIWVVLLLALLVPLHAKSSEDTIYQRQKNNAWFKAGNKLIQDNLKLKPIAHTAKNVILFLGDGMGVSTVTAARILEGQMEGKTGEENVLSFEEFPWSALSKTYMVDYQVADSAGTATAYLCGVKTDDGVIGVDEKIVNGDCSSLPNTPVLSILAIAEMNGMATGIVTTARVTHATPSAAYAHSPMRDWENDAETEKANASNCKDIARQLIEFPYGDGIDVVFGGGRRNFYPNSVRDPEYGSFGKRLDGRNLTQEWVKQYKNSQYIWNKDQFNKVDADKVEHLLGLFEPSHMQYEIERNTTLEPSITEMTEKAIKILSKNPKGFFLLVEGGRIDHGHHAGVAKKALTDAIAMAKAVTKAREMTKLEETLMITTADHSHVFTIAGYPTRGNDILGLVDATLDKNGMKYTTLGYANGPGGVNSHPRENLTGVDTTTDNYKQQSLVQRSSETHGGEDVGVYAAGPSAHLFHGVIEQNYIFHVMDHALCLTESKKDGCKKYKTRGGSQHSSTHYSAQRYNSITWFVVFVSAVNMFFYL